MRQINAYLKTNFVYTNKIGPATENFHKTLELLIFSVRVSILFQTREVFIRIYVTVNLRNQLFPGIPNPFRESGKYLKFIEIPRNP